MSFVYGQNLLCATNTRVHVTSNLKPESHDTFVKTKAYSSIVTVQMHHTCDSGLRSFLMRIRASDAHNFAFNVYSCCKTLLAFRVTRYL